MTNLAGKRGIKFANKKIKERNKNQIKYNENNSDFSKDQIEDADLYSDMQVNKELPLVKLKKKNFELPDYLL